MGPGFCIQPCKESPLVTVALDVMATSFLIDYRHNERSLPPLVAFLNSCFGDVCHWPTSLFLWPIFLRNMLRECLIHEKHRAISVEFETHTGTTSIDNGIGFARCIKRCDGILYPMINSRSLQDLFQTTCFRVPVPQISRCVSLEHKLIPVQILSIKTLDPIVIQKLILNGLVVLTPITRVFQLIIMIDETDAHTRNIDLHEAHMVWVRESRNYMSTWSHATTTTIVASAHFSPSHCFEILSRT